MQSKVVSFKVDQTELKSIDETLDRMRSMLINTPIRVTRSDALRSMMADRQLHRLKLIDLTSAQSSLTARISENLHELEYPVEDIQKIMLGIAEAIKHEGQKTDLISEV